MKDFEKISQYLNIDIANKTFLITGASGLIGLYLAKYLLSQNAKVIAISRTLRHSHPELVHDNLKIIGHDFTKPGFFDFDCDYIIHCAGLNSPELFINEPIKTLDVAYKSTQRVLELAHKKNAKVLYLSSCEVYPTDIPHTPYDETSRLDVRPERVRDCYPISKIMCENMCTAYKSQYNVDVKIARLGHIWGLEYNENSKKVDAYIINQALSHNNIILKSDGKQVRTYCYVGDCVSALLFILFKCQNEYIFNVVDKPDTIENFALDVSVECGVNLSLGQGHSNINSCVSDNKLRNAGWKPLFTIENVLSQYGTSLLK